MLNLTVGQQASRTITLTQHHVETYAELTGDYNPLHFDEAFVAGTKFGALVVQGGLTTGLLHALVAMDMPGPGTVFLSQNWKFTAPVFIGDTITATAEVLSVHRIQARLPAWNSHHPPDRGSRPRRRGMVLHIRWQSQRPSNLRLRERARGIASKFVHEKTG